VKRLAVWHVFLKATVNAMAPEMRIVAISDDSGQLINSDLLANAECVHRQLRPQLPAAYAVRMAVVFSNGGRMAVVTDGSKVICVALWRVIENTYEGRRLYVDDLVSDQSSRSQGAGRMMLSWLEDKACALGCEVLALDSGVQRSDAHRFYFREGMHISAYSFRKILK
jgi:GNAT superfamily N-acetyltransferase